MASLRLASFCWDRSGRFGVSQRIWSSTGRFRFLQWRRPASLIRPTFAFASFCFCGLCADGKRYVRSRIRRRSGPGSQAAIDIRLIANESYIFTLLRHFIHRRYTEHRRPGGDFRSLLSAYHVSGWPAAVHSCHYACRKAMSAGRRCRLEMNGKRIDGDSLSSP